MNPLEVIGLIGLTIPIGWFCAFVWSHKIGSVRTTAGVITDGLRSIGLYFVSLSYAVDRGVLEFRERQRDARINYEVPGCDRWESIARAWRRMSEGP